MAWDSKSYWEKMFPPRIRVRGGIRAQNKRGAFATTWWAEQWEAYIINNMDSGRLARARTYARQGQVTHLDLEGEGIAAKVQGSDPRPYKVSIHLKAVNDTQRRDVITALKANAGAVAALLGGELPEAAKAAFKVAKAPLFPVDSKDVTVKCSCPDYAVPCKHAGAVLSLITEALNQDPMLLLQLRGISRDALLGDAQPHAVASAPALAAPAPRDLDQPKRRGRSLAKVTKAVIAPPVAVRAPAPVLAQPSPALPRAHTAFWGPVQVSVGAAVTSDGRSHADGGVDTLERIGKLPFWRAQTPFAEAMQTFYRAAQAHAQGLLSG